MNQLKILKYNPDFTDLLKKRYEIGIFIPYASSKSIKYLFEGASMNKFAFFYVDKVFNSRMIYFDHKIADLISVNTSIIQGYTGKDEDYLPYINACLYLEDPTKCAFPPYKNKTSDTNMFKNLRLGN